MEDIKFTILSSLQPYEEINSEKIAFILEKNSQLTTDQKNIKNQIYAEWVSNTKKTPSIHELRQINNVSYSLNFFDEKQT